MLSVLMVLSIAKIGVAHAEYYTSRAALGAASGGGVVSYYADGGDHAGVWVSGGGWSMAAGSPVTADALRAALSCRDPETNAVLGRRYTPGGTYRDALGVERLRRSPSAFDLTYSVPKSISAAWALADDATREEIEAAFDLSVGSVVDYLQAHAVVSRKGAGGVDQVAVPDGAAVARFDHYTSRAGDPQLHAHLLWMNRVLCEDGEWRTLDGRYLYRHLQAASMYGAAVIRAELSRRLGWQWDRIGQNRHAEVAGVPKPIIDHWSQRRRVVARAAQRKVRAFEKKTGREPTPEERLAMWNEATVQTREAKRDELGTDLHREWRRDAIELGYHPPTLTASYRTAERVDPDRYDRPEVLVGPWGSDIDTTLSDQVLALVEQHSVGINDAQLNGLLYSVINASPEMENPKAGGAREAVDAVFNDLRTKVCDRMLSVDGMWYSPGLISSEAAALSWLASPAVPVVGAGADVEGLSSDQTEAVNTLLASTSRGTVVVGPAGAGKTTMLARFAKAVGTQRVVAVAPTAVAAAELGASLGVAADTVAKVVLDADRIPAGAWVIVDEASQLATRDMAALCGRTAEAGGRLILVGDHAQQGSITAGGLFATAARNSDIAVATLSELWRFADAAEAAATARLRVGDPHALRYHHHKGRVTATAHTEAPETVGEWWEQHRDQTTLVSAPSQMLAGEINADIAARRHALGETGPVVAGDGDGAIRIGDVITTRRNNRKLVTTDGKWVRNGDRWTVEWALAGGGLRARNVDTNSRVDLPGGYVDDHVDLGYAVTHTRAQSATVDAALTVVGASTRLPEMYVGLTRGRHSNRLVVVTDRPAYDEDSPTEHLQPAEILAAILKRTNDQHTAIDAHQTVLDPAAAAEHLQAVANTAHNAPLPVHEDIDPAALLSARKPRIEGTERDLLEQRVGAAINAWLAGVEDVDLYEGLTDAEKAIAAERFNSYLAEPEDHGGYDAEPIDDIPDTEYAALFGETADTNPAIQAEEDTPSSEAAYADAYDNGEWIPADEYDDYPHEPDAYLDTDDRFDEQPPHGETARETAPPSDDREHEQTDHEAAGKAETPVPVPAGNWLAQAQWKHDLGATWQTYDLAGGIVHETFGTDPRGQGGFPPTDSDNPHLLQAVRRYTQARYTGDDHTAATLAAVISQIADTPLRDLLGPHTDTTLLTPQHREWATQVRRSVLANRAERYRTALDALDQLREPVRSQATQTVTEDPRGATITTGTIADRDRSRWTAECHAWLDAGAQPAELLKRWNNTDQHLADTANGQTTPEPGSADWRTIPSPTDAPPPSGTIPTTTEAAPTTPAPNTEQPTGRRIDQARGALRKATSYYHRQLLHSPEAAKARQYLQDRGIGPHEWETWELGWAPDRWDAVTSLIHDDNIAEAAGLSKRGRHGRTYDRLRGRIMFPVRTADGQIAGFAGRTLDPDNPAKYLNTPATDLYNKSELLFGLSHAKNHITHTGEAVLVEGYTDAIAAHRNGLTNTIATGGTAFTQQHTDQILNCGPTEITIMYDGDPAGRSAARKAGALCAANDLPVNVVDLPAGKDPADLDPHQLEDAYQQPLPHLWNEIRIAAQRRNLADPTQATQAVTDVLPLALNDPILELIATQQTSGLLSIPLDTTLQILQQHNPHHTPTTHGPTPTAAAL